MPSSKIWRKDRWFWSCSAENRTMSWKDHWACRAIGRLTYSTQKEAQAAGQQHTYKTNHPVSVQQIKRQKT